MKVQELIAAFADKCSLPIDVNDVMACLRDNGHEDDIEFVGVDLDPDILQGTIKVFHVRKGVYAEPEKWVNIYYHRGHGVDWQRMISCKELIHLLDPPSAYTNTAADIQRLAEKIGLPPEMQDPGTDGFATNIDRMAEFRAIALLLPLAARDQLREPLKDGRLTLADIARMADIPSKYAGFVMSDSWPAFYELLRR